MYSLRSRRKIGVKEPIAEKILSKRINDEGDLQYFIKWKGLPDSDGEWQSAETLDCLKLVEAYEYSTMYHSVYRKRKFYDFEDLPSGSIPKRKARAKKSNAHIDCLPTEIMLKILSYFPQNDLGRFARVNKRWYELTKCEQLWKRVDVLFQWKNGSQDRVATVFLESLPASVTHLRLHFWPLDWIKPLKFPVFCAKLGKKYPFLKVLTLQFTVFTVSLQSALNLCGQHLPNLDVLSFSQCTFTDYSVKRRYDDFYKIKVLNLHSNIFPENSFQISFSKMTNLQRLSIGCMGINDSWFSADPSFLSSLEVLQLSVALGVGYRTFRLLKDYASKLKELYMCGTSVILRGIDLSDAVFSQLKIVCLKWCSNITLDCIIDLIYSCESLETVYVDDEMAERYAKLPFIAADKHKLQIVKTRKICRHHEYDY